MHFFFSIILSELLCSFPLSLFSLLILFYIYTTKQNKIEKGACGGELACSTCHLIFEKELYDTLPEKEEEEDDMLDLAFEVTET